MSSVLLETHDVYFAYEVEGLLSVVLRGINFRIEAGEFVAIQGSSGSGKSTLLYILGALLEPDHGEIILKGRNVSSLASEARAYLRNQTIGFVFQQFHLLPRASVLENILLPKFYPCEIADPDDPAHREKAIEIAKSLGLETHLDHRPNQLSGGQQQRVAIARAMMNDVDLILADEPTGNLDSVNAAQTMELFKELNRRGKTIVIITHDHEIAKRARRIVHIKDGVMVSSETLSQSKRAELKPETDIPNFFRSPQSILRSIGALLPLSWSDIRRNKVRSFLTMIGITIGIASVLAMITLGDFTKTKILESYESLGVNKLLVDGSPNWKLRATDKVNLKFQSFDIDKDIGPLLTIFPQIRHESPVLQTRNVTANFNGNQITNDVFIRGVNAEFAVITNSELAMGKFIDRFQVEARSPVCVIGWDVAKQLFLNTSPLNQLVYLTTGAPDPFPCLVIGVLKSRKSNSEWNKPNSQIIIPYTLLPSMTDSWWDAQIHQVVLQLEPGSDVEAVSKAIRALFVQKYGISGRFNIDSDAILLAQMKKFLSLFTVLLASIAFISLFVGGIGITNMMLVSVSERFKEIGLRKALGATDFSIRIQLLLEAVLVCVIAGVIGMIAGFTVYELLIYAASHFVKQLKFEWVINPHALAISVLSVIAVGVASGIVPALRAEKLQVIEALRSE